MAIIKLKSQVENVLLLREDSQMNTVMTRRDHETDDWTDDL